VSPPEQSCHLFTPEVVTGISSSCYGSALCSACLCGGLEQLGTNTDVFDNKSESSFKYLI